MDSSASVFGFFTPFGCFFFFFIWKMCFFLRNMLSNRVRNIKKANSSSNWPI